MPIVEFSVVPIGTGSVSVGEYVRTAVGIVRQSGLDYSVGPMGTCVQGDWDKVFSTIGRIHESLAAMGCARIVTTIKVDDRRDRAQTMQSKVDRALG